MFPVVDIAAECTVHRPVQGEGLDQLPRRAPLVTALPGDMVSRLLPTTAVPLCGKHWVESRQKALPVV